MILILWLVLCGGPAVISYLKGRSPLTFFGIALGLTFGLYLLAWGFMDLTGAPGRLARTTGTMMGFVGLAASYAVAFLTNPSDSGLVNPFWQRKRELQCPNCAGFISEEDDRCPHCRTSLK